MSSIVLHTRGCPRNRSKCWIKEYGHSKDLDMVNTLHLVIIPYRYENEKHNAKDPINLGWKLEI